MQAAGTQLASAREVRAPSYPSDRSLMHITQMKVMASFTPRLQWSPRPHMKKKLPAGNLKLQYIVPVVPHLRVVGHDACSCCSCPRPPSPRCRRPGRRGTLQPTGIASVSISQYSRVGDRSDCKPTSSWMQRETYI
jgi:hypothetical protein